MTGQGDLFGARAGVQIPPGAIRAISLHQPWASLMAWRLKIHETRGWSTEHRGPLAIHAAKAVHDYARSEAQLNPAIRQALEARRLTIDALPLGAVLAVCRLEKCLPSDLVRPDSVDGVMGNFEHGRYAWQTADMTPLDPPVPARGKQGIWWWTPPAGLVLPGWARGVT